MSSMFSKYVGELDADGLTIGDQPFTVRPLVLKKHRTGRITNYRFFRLSLGKKHLLF
ncbi:hypothetical protein RLOC_00009994 [Lonchura striata]|uniref:Uncharacterized protein n=1 Tax=Lonchura striata TaxID=40157 RepID=A0A218UP52_9PASE|nr:hypothetical protein RLOC_00009994 [Lonchura striata domestica]